MKPTTQIHIGNIKLGNNNPIIVQSMTNTLTKDIDKTIQQIHQLQEAGCELVRVSVPDIDSLNALKTIKENISIPLIADIHYDPKLAIESLKYADKIRINPGNIGDKEKLKQIIEAAKQYNKPIRIGVNLGSLEKDIEQKYGHTAQAMVESALRHIEFFEQNDFHNIVLSLKASGVKTTVEAYKLISERTDYPLHIGITESGTLFSGTINSSVGIGILLSQGIGDTVRVSLSADPVEEVKVAWQILRSLNLRNRGVKITSCPTCARANINVEKIAKELEQRTQHIKDPLHIAIMGCVVNGPGEAKNADIGVVGGKCEHLLYEKGEIKGKVDDEKIVEVILNKIKSQKQ